MRTSIKRRTYFFALPLALLSLLFIAMVNSLLAQTNYCVIAVIDGQRYSESFGDSAHFYIPFMWDSLAPKGTLYTNYYNNGWTKTTPGHSSILTGTWQHIANDGTEGPHMPTLFEYCRSQKGDYITDHWVVLGKDKLNVLTHSDHHKYGEIYGAAVVTSTSQYDDLIAYNNTISIISEHHPRLLISNFPKTDKAGHSGVWKDYVNAIKVADSLMLELWTFIQNDPIYKDKTTLIITNDHGRHLDGIESGFISHGDNCEGCRHIMLLILGPNAEAGKKDTMMYEQIDIAPTIGRLLDFDLPYAEGQIIGSIITHIDESNTYQMPDPLIEIDNYPNPFNPSTTISFDIHAQTWGSLEVYSIKGKKIETIYRGLLKKGKHITEWNATGFSSGTYIIQLNTQMGRISKRCILLK